MLQEFWEFISSPENRDTITWIAGGMAALAAGVWTVLRFFAQRSSGSEERAQNVTVSADRGSVAGGRDVHIGLRGASVIALVVLILSIALILSSRFGDALAEILMGEYDEIPILELEFQCPNTFEPGSNLVYSGVASQFEEFISKTENHNGEIVYANIAIKRACNACGCSDPATQWVDIPRWYYFYPDWLDELDQSEVPSDQEVNEFVQRWGERDGESLSVGSIAYMNGNRWETNLTPEQQRSYISENPSMWFEGYAISVNLDWAYSTEVYLPRPSHLSDRQYTQVKSYGMELEYDGFFIARFYDRTGASYAWLEPISPDESLMRRLSCIREGREVSVVSRLVSGC